MTTIDDGPLHGRVGDRRPCSDGCRHAKCRTTGRALTPVDSLALDANEVHPGIWVGAAPRDKAAAALAFTHIVLCSEAWQFPAADFAPATVLHCPFEDEDTLLRGAILTMVFLAARAVAEAARSGGRVLVSCAAGRNRSALVAGLAMRMLGEQLVVEKIRTRRRADCLTNTCFRRIVTGENKQTEWFLP